MTALDLKDAFFCILEDEQSQTFFVLREENLTTERKVQLSLQNIDGGTHFLDGHELLTGIFSKILHPVVVLLMLTLLCFVLIAAANICI